MKNNITNKLCSSVVLFTLCSLNFLWKLTNSKQPKSPKSKDDSFAGLFFLKKGKANNKSATLRLAAPAFIIMPTKIP